MAQDDIEFLSFNLQNSGVGDVYHNVNWFMQHWRLKSWLSVQQGSIIPTELYPQYHIFLFIMFLHCHKILEDGPELLDICGCLSTHYLCQINLDALRGEKEGSGLKKVMRIILRYHC